MNSELLWVLTLLLIAIVLFTTNKLRMDVVALLVIIAFVMSGTLSLGEATSGFSDPNVILIAALFVIGEGLVRTGVAYQVGDWLVKVAGHSETKMLALLMVTVAGLGAFMSSTGVVAIFIPGGIKCRQSDEDFARAINDATKFCRAYQWHDDAGRDATQYGGEQ
uniref:Citrate transporter-like domain-containing protein n=1 Tax=Yersinia enterocolitica W22703 TaxID=913028 RepID=F4N020_YEREN|nr:hypothetical protein YEW_EE18060 [Yersinia enterocolitica W22703]